MRKDRLDPSSLKRLDQAIGKAETHSAVEIVAAVAPRSGSYRDIALSAGIATSFLSLAVVLYTPWSFNPLFVLPDTVVFFLIGFLAVRSSPRIIRTLAAAARKRRQVHALAMEEFFNQGIGATAGGTGLLVLYSRLERMVEIIGDVGLMSALPAADWHKIETMFRERAERSDRPIDGIAAAIGESGEVFSRWLPPGEKNPNELPNHPRILA